jgi:hypothetical protein
MTHTKGPWIYWLTKNKRLAVVTIDWQRYKVKKHRVDEMKLVEKWQPIGG